MKKLAIALLLVSSPAFAQSQTVAADCTPIGKTAKGEMVYAMNCSSLKAENASPEYKPAVAPTDMKDTVIPKAGSTQTPETTPTTGVNK